MCVCLLLFLNEWMNADENRIECFRCLSKSTHRWSVQHVFLFIIIISLYYYYFFLVFCFGGGCWGNQAILLRGFGGELKGWEDSEIQCPSPGWDLSNYTVAENSYSLFGYLFVFSTVIIQSLSIWNGPWPQSLSCWLVLAIFIWPPSTTCHDKTNTHLAWIL